MHHLRTRDAFMLSRVLRTPFWALFSMLPFIVYKELHATPFQIALMVALKPVVSVFSLYWSSAVNQRRDLLVANINWASVLGLLPFFFFPVVDNTWYFVAAFGIYMMMHRGVIPSWMEIFKLNLPEASRHKIFAYGSAFGYVGDAIFPFFFGWMMDGYVSAWRWLFPATACIALVAVVFQSRILIRMEGRQLLLKKCSSIKEHASKPWREAWYLILARPDFRAFQIGFMLGGSALMIMQAVLPEFFMGVLKLSYKELAIALALCKGLGFALTSQLWAKWMNRVDIYRFSAAVTLVAALFPLLLFFAQLHLSLLYLAYVSYGIMQAGSELSWNLSGPIFAKEEDSTPFSSVNVLTVGLRGAFAPWVGSLLLFYGNAYVAIFIGVLLCLAATASMLRCRNTRSMPTLERPQ